VGTMSVELYEQDGGVLRELMQAIERRPSAIREQLRLFPGSPVERAGAGPEGPCSGMVRAGSVDGPR
jgi:hypothetical protein